MNEWIVNMYEDKIELLQISDLHLDQQLKAQQQKILENLTAFCHKKHVEPDFLIIPGDIIEKGSWKKNGAYAVNTIKKMCKDLSIDIKNRLIISPGNHDVERDRAGQADIALFNDLKSSAHFPKEITRFSSCLSKFSGYNDFLREIGQKRLTDTFFRLYPKDDRIVFISLTSPILEGNPIRTKGIQEFGFIPEGSLIRALDETRNRMCIKSPLIAVFHHPFETWPELRYNLTDHLMRTQISVVCTGHMHHHDLRNIGDPYGAMTQLQSGNMSFPIGTNQPSFQHTTLFIKEGEIESGRSFVYVVDQKKDEVKFTRVEPQVANNAGWDFLHKSSQHLASTLKELERLNVIPDILERNALFAQYCLDIRKIERPIQEDHVLKINYEEAKISFNGEEYTAIKEVKDDKYTLFNPWSEKIKYTIETQPAIYTEFYTMLAKPICRFYIDDGSGQMVERLNQYDNIDIEEKDGTGKQYIRYLRPRCVTLNPGSKCKIHLHFETWNMEGIVTFVSFKEFSQGLSLNVSIPRKFLREDHWPYVWAKMIRDGKEEIPGWRHNEPDYTYNLKVEGMIHPTSFVNLRFEICKMIEEEAKKRLENQYHTFLSQRNTDTSSHSRST